MKLAVGQKLQLMPSYLDARKNDKPKEVTIKSIGRKYFKIEEYPQKKYNIETLDEVNESNYRGQCYINLQEVSDLKEYSNLLAKIKDAFSNFDQIDITLNQLRKINDILFFNQKNKKNS